MKTAVHATKGKVILSTMRRKGEGLNFVTTKLTGCNCRSR